MSKCLQCGMCCKVIVMPYALEYDKNYYTGSDNEDFIQENWFELTLEEAVSLNPSISDIEGTYYYYQCKKLDNTGKCLIYDTPEFPRTLCGSFPMSKESVLHLPQCGYKATLNRSMSDVIKERAQRFG